MSGAEEDASGTRGFCGACCGLHMSAHGEEDCPLVASAAAECDCAPEHAGECSWQDSACPRRLFSLLVSIQIMDGCSLAGKRAARW